MQQCLVEGTSGVIYTLGLVPRVGGVGGCTLSLRMGREEEPHEVPLLAGPVEGFPSGSPLFARGSPLDDRVLALVGGYTVLIYPPVQSSVTQYFPYPSIAVPTPGALEVRWHPISPSHFMCLRSGGVFEAYSISVQGGGRVEVALCDTWVFPLPELARANARVEGISSTTPSTEDPPLDLTAFSFGDTSRGWEALAVFFLDTAGKAHVLCPAIPTGLLIPHTMWSTLHAGAIQWGGGGGDTGSAGIANSSGGLGVDSLVLEGGEALHWLVHFWKPVVGGGAMCYTPSDGGGGNDSGGCAWLPYLQGPTLFQPGFSPPIGLTPVSLQTLPSSSSSAATASDSNAEGGGAGGQEGGGGTHHPCPTLAVLYSDATLAVILGGEGIVPAWCRTAASSAPATVAAAAATVAAAASPKLCPLSYILEDTPEDLMKARKRSVGVRVKRVGHSPFTPQFSGSTATSNTTGHDGSRGGSSRERPQLVEARKHGGGSKASSWLCVRVAGCGGGGGGYDSSSSGGSGGSGGGVVAPSLPFFLPFTPSRPHTLIVFSPSSGVWGVSVCGLGEVCALLWGGLHQREPLHQSHHHHTNQILQQQHSYFEGGVMDFALKDSGYHHYYQDEGGAPEGGGGEGATSPPLLTTITLNVSHLAPMSQPTSLPQPHPTPITPPYLGCVIPSVKRREEGGMGFWDCPVLASAAVASGGSGGAKQQQLTSSLPLAVVFNELGWRSWVGGSGVWKSRVYDGGGCSAKDGGGGAEGWGEGGEELGEGGEGYGGASTTTSSVQFNSPHPTLLIHEAQRREQGLQDVRGRVHATLGQESSYLSLLSSEEGKVKVCKAIIDACQEWSKECAQLEAHMGDLYQRGKELQCLSEDLVKRGKGLEVRLGEAIVAAKMCQGNGDGVVERARELLGRVRGVAPRVEGLSGGDMGGGEGGLAFSLEYTAIVKRKKYLALSLRDTLASLFL